MAHRTLNLSLPTQLVQRVDDQAKLDFSSRSDFIRKAIVNQLRIEQNLQNIFDQANAKGKELGVTSEQQVYDTLESRH